MSIVVNPRFGMLADPSGNPVITNGVPEWTFTRTLNPDGYGIFAISVWDYAHGQEDVTFFRGAPTIIRNMTFADPFGDATAEIEFPQCSGYDSTTNVWWLRENVNVDISWVPATKVDNGTTPVLDPDTNTLGRWLHIEDSVVLWEGFFSGINPSLTGVSITCQGCLYQLDRYYAKPLFPLRPKAMENMIARYFDPKRRGLWTKALAIDFYGLYPISKGFNWTRHYTEAEDTELRSRDQTLLRFVPTDLVPPNNGVSGSQWTGYLTRMTGSWDKALTGYVRSQLATMYVIPDKMDDPNGVKEGDMWTITKAPGRQPVMYVRRQDAPIDLVCWYGAPGVDVSLSRDGTQVNNVIFGRGTGYDGSTWLVQNFPATGPWTYWAPIAWDKEPDTARGNSVGYDETPPPSPTPEWIAEHRIGVYHWEDVGWSAPALDGTGNEIYPNQYLRDALYDGYDADWERENDYWVQEKSWNNIPSGIDQSVGEDIGQQYIEREKDPGWSGTITLQADVRTYGGSPFSKWQIRDGMSIWLRGWRGEVGEVRQGSPGDPNIFHISQVTIDPQTHTVTLTVDSKYRDLLSVEEALQHTRDTLAPVSMLQVGKESALVEDLAVAWNNNKGAGCFPPESVKMTKATPFPFVDDTTAPGNSPADIFKPAYIDGSGSVINLSNKHQVVHGQLNKGAQDSYADLHSFLDDTSKPWYVPINYGNPNENCRWGFMQVPLSQAGTIARTEFAAYDKNGNLCDDVEFHVSMYKALWVTVDAMPVAGRVTGMDEFPAGSYVDVPNGDGTFSAGKHAALWDGAFEKIDPDTGFIWDGGPSLNYQYHLPADAAAFMIGWGTAERPGGYSPGSKDLGGQPTGMLMDGAPIPFDMTSSHEFGAAIANQVATGEEPPNTSYAVTIAIYAQHVDGASTGNKWCYFMGRFYRQIQTGK